MYSDPFSESERVWMGSEWNEWECMRDIDIIIVQNHKNYHFLLMRSVESSFMIKKAFILLEKQNFVEKNK